MAGPVVQKRVNKSKLNSWKLHQRISTNSPGRKVEKTTFLWWNLEKMQRKDGQRRAGSHSHRRWRWWFEILQDQESHSGSCQLVCRPFGRRQKRRYWSGNQRSIDFILRDCNLHCLSKKEWTEVRPHCRNSRKLVDAEDDGHGEKLPSDTAVPHELQGAFSRGRLNGSLFGQHLVHLLFVVTFAPQTLESWDAETGNTETEKCAIQLTWIHTAVWFHASSGVNSDANSTTKGYGIPNVLWT